MTFSRALTFVYALMLCSGGIMGYTKAGSIASLVMGSIFGLLFLVSSILYSSKPFLAAWINRYGSLALTLFFLYRFSGSWKFMPAGLMFVLSLVVFLTSLLSKRARAKKSTL